MLRITLTLSAVFIYAWFIWELACSHSLPFPVVTGLAGLKSGSCSFSLASKGCNWFAKSDAVDYFCVSVHPRKFSICPIAVSGHRERIQNNRCSVGSSGGRGESKCTPENRWATWTRAFYRINRHRSSPPLCKARSAPAPHSPACLCLRSLGGELEPDLQLKGVEAITATILGKIPLFVFL